MVSSPGPTLSPGGTCGLGMRRGNRRIVEERRKTRKAWEHSSREMMSGGRRGKGPNRENNSLYQPFSSTLAQFWTPDISMIQNYSS